MKHWVFDLDGTLVDSFAPYFTALKEICLRHGKDFSIADQQMSLSAPSPVFLANRIGPENVDMGMEFLNKKNISDAQTIRLFPHVNEALVHLKKRGKTISVLTNRDFESAEQLLKTTGIHPLVSILVGGTCVSRPKPDTEGLFKIAKFHQALPKELVMIGDHDMDVHVGKNGGAHAIRASWHGHWEINKCAVADQQFFSTREFLSWAQTK